MHKNETIKSELPLFYCPNMLLGNVIDGDEAFHAIKVLRICVDDKIQITDGIGNAVTAIVTQVSKKAIQYKITEVIEVPKLKYNLHLVVAPTKNMERYENMLEKSTEFGFSMLTPIICHHSERTIVKTDRLNRIMIAAAKQSQKAMFPTINEPIKFKKFMEQTHDITNKYIALCRDCNRISLLEAAQKSPDAIVLIGPEGDFSEEEATLAIQHGYVPISLGNSRLRTETAGIAACHTFYVTNQ
ncbi:MAG: RsmE family RNA methyltransferase [Salinivirgaceae bacterium]|nr:RsmE family RNA methyltransferase [Salinivirgaceae bacterium]